MLHEGLTHHTRDKLMFRAAKFLTLILAVVALAIDGAMMALALLIALGVQ